MAAATAAGSRYLALDHGPGREANLGKLHDLPVATMVDDLCRSYC